jgi:heptaprenyl diphosphate synthase
VTVKTTIDPVPPDVTPHPGERATAVAISALPGDLARVERVLQESVRTSDGFLAEAEARLAAEGNRLRPTLTLSAAYATGSAVDRALIGAAACELVHLGSSCHDDVIDEAEAQRGVPRVNAHWNNIVAVLAGDQLLAQASALAASLGAAVAGLLAETIGEVSRGRMLELQHRFDINRSEADYESAIAGKTAALLATSCRIGAMASSTPEATLDALTRFGFHLGMCFQIVDDVLDLSPTVSSLTDAAPGRPAGRDLLDGIYTLPVIYALRDSADLRTMLGGPLDDEQLAHARRVVMAGRAVGDALRVARAHAAEATESLTGADALRPEVRAALIDLLEPQPRD